MRRGMTHTTSNPIRPHSPRPQPGERSRRRPGRLLFSLLLALLILAGLAPAAAPARAVAPKPTATPAASPSPAAKPSPKPTPSASPPPSPGGCDAQRKWEWSGGGYRLEDEPPLGPLGITLTGNARQASWSLDPGSPYTVV